MATSAESKKNSSGFLVAPRVPQGLAAAVEGLTREVIRQKPEDIYVFAAHHFEKLLRLREEYGTSGIALERDARALRDMGLGHLMGRERFKPSTKVRNEAETSGWSLNQTAKVLKRHRSIVGDSDDANEHFNPANDNQSTSRMPMDTHTCTKTPRNHRKSLTRLVNDSSLSNESQSGDSEARSTPKIISQMSNTGLSSKDIKNELRKNRISSRDRRSIPRCEEKKRIERVNTSYESFECLSKSSSRRSSVRTKKSEKMWENGYDVSGKLKRTPSMDKVKDYVVEKFSKTRNLEELQSLHYVEKVQEVIDQTEPIIKEKVEELKKEVYRSKKKTRKEESNSADIESKLNETQRLLERVSSTLSKPPGRSRSARGLRRIRSVSMVSTEGLDEEGREEVMISELLITNGQKDGLDVRINDSTSLVEDQKRKRSLSAKASRRRMFQPENSVSENFGLKGEALETMLNETRNILAGISSSFVMQNGFRKSRGSGSASSSSKSEELENQDPLGSGSKVSLPAVQSKSAKNIARNSQKSDSEDLLLPVISPEAPKSAKLKEDLILPVLSPPKSSPSGSKEPDIPEAPVEEVFKDSLNVTPEPIADFGPRPDSLEPEERIEDIEPPSELKEKLLEIQNIEHNIEKIFGNEEKISVMEPEEPQNHEKSEDKLENPEPKENSADSEQKLEQQDVNKATSDAKVLQVDAKVAEIQKADDNCDTKGDGDFEVSPHTYILTEGSPYDIPESVTTVIIPEPPKTPESERIKLPEVPEVEELEEGDKSSILDPSESFGEEIHPEEQKAPLIDLILSREMTLPKHNLQCINEEEGAEDEEALEDGVSEVPSSFLDIDEEGTDLKSSAVDVSDDFTRPEAVSASSTSAKETSITDGPMETPKLPAESGEEGTSESETVESSNEAKETTLTDGTSFSIDPTRPFIPELNLDSLQDITVSSFKMTEDEYEPGETENTNSFSETLTPDDNNRIVSENGREMNSSEAQEAQEAQEAHEAHEAHETHVLDSNSLISESLNTKNDEVEEKEHGEVVVAEEEPCVQEFVEINEPICEKASAYVSEPAEETESMTFEAQADLEDLKQSPVSLEVNAEAEESPVSLEVNAEPEESPVSPEVNPEKSQTESDSELREEEKDDENEEKESESDNFVDEDTPLAVSRSASQCTTRRVSSGNLARLREDIRLEEGEEEEEEAKSEEARVKFQGERGEELETGEDPHLVIIAGEEGDFAPVDDDTDNNGNAGIMESKEYHIYVPELDQSEESSSESSFNSAATKIQAGVRGFLTRRRLQRMHHLSSTLNGVPSIQDSIVIDESPLETLEVPGKVLPELEDAATTIQSNFRGYKARQRLRREDAMQRTTISMEQKPFAENGIHHTGEFHDCIPLPLFDFPRNTPISSKNSEEPVKLNGEAQGKTETPRQTMGMMFGIPPVLHFGLTPKLSQLVDMMVITKDESAVESGYLNFITSVEDTEVPPVFKPPETPGSDVSGENTREFVDLSPRRGVIIEEITSLEEAKILSEIREKENSPAASEEVEEEGGKGEAAETEPSGGNKLSGTKEDESGQVESEIDIVRVLEAPLATLGFPMSKGKLLHYGSEDCGGFHERRPMLEVTLTPGDPIKSLSLSQESQLAGERIESPITMMQIAPGRGASLLQDDSSEMIGSDDKKDAGESSETVDDEKMKENKEIN